jgi:hypothetical protein
VADIAGDRLRLISRVFCRGVLLFFFARFGGIVGGDPEPECSAGQEAAVATRKKAKGKAKTARKSKIGRKDKAPRKKTPVSKGARRTSVKKIKTARKKAVTKPPLRSAPRKKARPAKPAGKPRPVGGRAPQAAAPAPSRPAKEASSEQRIGVVTHYFSHLSVVVMQLEPGATLRVGDVIHIWGHTTDFKQKVESLEIDRAPVAEVGSKDDFGLKVIEHARENDVVFKVRS